MYIEKMRNKLYLMILLVSKKEKNRFENQHNITKDDLAPTKPDIPLSTKEKNSYNKIIAGLVVFQYAWNGTKPNNLADEIIKDTRLKGITLTKTKLVEILKESSEFLS